MDPRLLEYYNQELTYLREIGAEFSAQFPKVAARLGMQGIDIADPYVERLLEGFAFLSARIHLKFDAQFPRFSQRLLEVIYPNYLAPTPSMCVVKLALPTDTALLLDRAIIPRGAVMRSRVPRGERSAVEFRTAHQVQLLPIETSSAQVTGAPPDRVLAQTAVRKAVKAAVRIRLKFVVPVDVSRLSMDRIVFYLNGRDEVVSQLYERIFCHGVGILVSDAKASETQPVFLPETSIERVGFSEDESLLPYSARGFQGYRLFHEYFAFPPRFWFVAVTGIQDAIRRLQSQEFEICILLDSDCADLEQTIDASYFELHCTPIVNLTERRLDRILLTGERTEHHVVADRAKPLDYEIYALTEANGVTPENAVITRFHPFFSSAASEHTQDSGAYYSVRREPRLTSDTVRRYGQRTSYIGSEVFISLVDQAQAPYSTELQHLSLAALVTNRDLPLLMPLGGDSDFSLVLSSPVGAIKVLRGPSKPTPALAEQEITWRLISHLGLNYVALTDVSETEGASALRELLSLYSALSEPNVAKQIDGITKFSISPVTRRLPGSGPLIYGRGVGGKLVVDEAFFAGTSAYLLGCVFDQFFTRHVSINSFTELSLWSSSRGEIHTWCPRFGTRPSA